MEKAAWRSIGRETPRPLLNPEARDRDYNSPHPEPVEFCTPLHIPPVYDPL
jgi:hypothetical protein